MNKFIYTILIMTLCGKVMSQSKPSMRIQFDKPLYTSGETIWFAIFRTDSGYYDRSQEVIHFDLLSFKNEMVFNGKVLMEGRLAKGYMNLSTNLEEGYYRFRVYTISSLKNGGEYVTADLPIYSEWREGLEVYKFEELPDIEEEELDVEIERKSNFYSRRDTAEYKNLIDNHEKDWKYVFWVRPREYDKFPAIKSEIRKVPQTMQLFSNLEKEDSLYFEATLTTLDSDLGVTSPLISIYSSHNKHFNRSKASDGRLSLKVPYYEGESTLQVFNLNPYQDAVGKLSVRNWVINEGYYNSTKLVITPEIAEYLIKAKQRRKVNSLFSTTNQITVAAPDSGVAVPDKYYSMSEYRYINDLQDFVFEAIPGAKLVKQEDGSTSTRLYNPERRAIFVDRPWYIVDGYLTSREEEVLKIPFKDIEEIKLYVHTSTIKKYFEFFLWRNGIMEVTTNDVKYRRSLQTDPNYVEFKGFLPSRDFLNSAEMSGNPKLPDLRTTMYWETGPWPNDKKGIRFPLSDDTGKFIYQFFAISSSGETIIKQGYLVIR